MAWLSQETNDPPNALGCRAAHSCDKVNNCLYIFGGWNGQRALNDLHLYDLKNNEWSEPETMGQTPACRNNHTTAVYEDVIFVHGGHDGEHWLDDFYYLHTGTLTWHKPAIAGKKPSARACHTMSRVDRKVYMFGGYDGAKCFNDIEILDLHLMTWIQPNIYGKIPMARNAHTMTVIGTKLYLFGGHSGNKHLKDLHIFDTETLTWTEPQVFGCAPTGLRGHTANLVGNKIYLFGGYDGRGRLSKKIIVSNDLYVLDTETMTWTHPNNLDKVPTGRQRHSAAAIGQLGSMKLFIFGGFDGEKWLNDLCILDLWKLEAGQLITESTNSVISSMKKLVNNQLFSDVEFVVEGKSIYAHKSFLATRCEHFRAMFLNGMKESKQFKIEITDWSYDSYYHLIEYLYTGNIEGFKFEIAFELLGLADAYVLSGLKSLCELMLIQSVNPENVCILYIHASKSSANDLKKFAINFILNHYKALESTEGFKKFVEFPHLLLELNNALSLHISRNYF